jgi:hypothetical protein
LSECYNEIDTIEQAYQLPAKQCSRNENCDELVLGSLIKGLIAKGLRPFPDPPFTGLSYEKVQSSFLDLSIPTACEMMGNLSGQYTGSYYSAGHNSQTKCGVKDLITEWLSPVSIELGGLQLDQYCENKRKTVEKMMSS